MKKNRSEANFRSHQERDGKTVDEALYEDAKRRQGKHEQQKIMMKKLEEDKIQSTKPPVGTNNTKYAA